MQGNPTGHEKGKGEDQKGPWGRTTSEKETTKRKRGEKEGQKNPDSSGTTESPAVTKRLRKMPTGLVDFANREQKQGGGDRQNLKKGSLACEMKTVGARAWITGGGPDAPKGGEQDNKKS